MQWGPSIRPTCAEIALDSVVANARLLAKRAQSPILAVVKADAYGHGAVEVARALRGVEVVAGFAVSLVEEGIELRQAGITEDILIMGPSLMDAHSLLVEHGLIPMVSDARHLAPLAAAAQEAQQLLELHLKFDTGMGRLGLRPEDMASLLDEVAGYPSLRLLGLASHLACADVDDPENSDSKTAAQLARFAELAAQVRTRAPELKLHVANSAGILRFGSAHYDLARPGLALYGSGGEAEDGLLQAMSLCSEVTQLRMILPGESVSYGARWTAERDSLVAIVPIGYADGLPRNLTAKGSALVHGQRCPIVGTVSMDMIVVDVTNLVDPELGDSVVLLGRQVDASISVAEIAAHCEISEYEVTCGISKRVPRTYRAVD